ncbi:MAG: energy-coupling factor transporter transmembrane protein EcfT [Clostridia bacterium]|nr:energy-coupling factor transporter transmembrane protein EcfT [Clostridia bacterium]
MIKDITIGQYFIGNSFLHKMDARMKILLTFALIIAIFVCKSIPSLLLMVAITALLVAVSGVPFKMVLKSVKPIAIIVVFTGVLNLFYVRGGTTLFEWSFIHITTKGIFTAVFMAVRIICLVIISSLLTYTTTPTMLTDAIERLLSPLKVFKIPVHSLAMMMTLALRFIPTLIEEIDRISNAQKARGADLDSGGLIEKVKALIPIIVPLFVSSIRRAYELADAMDCRCYVGGDGRTRMKQMKLKATDFGALAVTALLIAGLVLLNHYFTKVI